MALSAVSAVARVAFFTSDVVVDLRQSSEYSIFSDEYKTLARKATHTPRIIPVSYAADPGAYASYHKSASLLAFTAQSSPRVLSQLLPHLSELSSSPIVLHFAVNGDLADVLRLRSAVPYFIHSSTLRQAHDNALIASRIARTERKAVVHIFQLHAKGIAAPELLEEQIRTYISQEKVAAPTNGKVNGAASYGTSSGHTNGHSNGHTNGHANGHTNGHANGHTNGYTNGYANGHANDLSDSSSSGVTTPSTPSSSFKSLDDPTILSLYGAYETASLSLSTLVRRPIQPLLSCGPSDAETVIFVFGQTPAVEVNRVRWVEVSLLSPLPSSKLLGLIPSDVKQIVVLEQIGSWNVKWTPLYLELMSALQFLDKSSPEIRSGLLGDPTTVTDIDVLKFLQQSNESSQRLRLGKASGSVEADKTVVSIPKVPKHEASYTKILETLFAERLEVANKPEYVAAHGNLATTPEFALGRVQRQLEDRDRLIKAVQTVVESSSPTSDLHSLLSKWLLARDDHAKSSSLGSEIISQLESNPSVHPLVPTILSLRAHFPAVSRWIIGSDAWSYDLGASGLHHLIASGLNVNTLILDTVPYSYRNVDEDPLRRRKRDVGLYAMNHGDVYVASVAVYSSYTQVLQALTEADRFPGPSVVLAYLPYLTEDVPALEVLKETKLAVDTGYWPLYRWNPSKENVTGAEPFSLDSDVIKQELQTFLDRQNHLSQLSRAQPTLAAELVSSLGEKVLVARQERAKKAYEDLLSGVGGGAGPLLVLYASDGGAAEKKARRLAARARARGLTTNIAVMDSTSLEELSKNEEDFVAFVTSVAGQGEAPQNGRALFKALNAAAARGERPLVSLKYSVFGMGDSHYWPRPEDAHFYNKAGKDLDTRLESLGATRFADLGLGDDQDADGSETGYKLWEPLIWKALGVDNVEIIEAEPDPITNEHMKIASNYLRGTIVEGLEDTSTGALAPSDTQLTKFHGIYQQDDRDIRDERTAQGAEPAYSFMIRVRMPGGVCSPEQWLAMDQISDEHGNGTFKITTRQTYQFHGVIKRHLKQTIRDINRALLDTLAACGDVNRFVLHCCIG